MDNEVKGEGNSYTTYFRQLDPRLGRWLCVDPKENKTPWESTYISMGNNPISQIDPMGDDKYKVDREGNISLKKKTNDKFDKIVGRTSIGLRKSIKIEKQIINSNAHHEFEGTKANGLTEDGKPNLEIRSFKVDSYSGPLGELQKTFEFLGKTTKVEWGLFKFGENSLYPSGILSTTHDESTEVMSRVLKDNPLFLASDFNGHDHIHPGGSDTPSGYYTISPAKPSGDVGFVKSMISLFQDKKMIFRIYISSSNTYINYDESTIESNENDIPTVKGNRK
jgi:RHS repeat-associated protein